VIKRVQFTILLTTKQARQINLLKWSESGQKTNEKQGHMNKDNKFHPTRESQP
jgi:hypothetical protein